MTEAAILPSFRTQRFGNTEEKIAACRALRIEFGFSNDLLYS